MTLYTAPACPKCEYAKQLLASTGHEFTVVNDTNAAVALGFHSAPTAVADDGTVMTYPQIIKFCHGGNNSESR